jgi:hypothetical protein
MVVLHKELVALDVVQIKAGLFANVENVVNEVLKLG